MFAFSQLMGIFHYQKDNFLRLLGDEQIDFIFDERGEKKQIQDGWDEYLKNRPPEVRTRFGQKPRFESDKRFRPLQAADYVAGWIRYWLEKGMQPAVGAVFAGKTLTRGTKHIGMTISEDQIVAFLIDAIRLNYSKPGYICDVRISFEDRLK
jgi:hypothetical protein